jgi:hypothetical protein
MKRKRFIRRWLLPAYRHTSSQRAILCAEAWHMLVVSGNTEGGRKKGYSPLVNPLFLPEHIQHVNAHLERTAHMAPSARCPQCVALERKLGDLLSELQGLYERIRAAQEQQVLRHDSASTARPRSEDDE